jgi:hypothetical protein
MNLIAISKQERRGDDEQWPQRQPSRNQVDEIEQHGEAKRCRGKAGKQARAPAAFGRRQRVDEQHGFGPSRNTARKASAPTAHTVSCDSADRPCGEIFLPAARILLHHQPAADIEHQGGGDENDDAFEDIAVLARVQHRKQPGRNDAGADGASAPPYSA